MGAGDYLPVDASLLPGEINFTPLPDGPECSEDDCLRPPYDEAGLCKFHSDLAHYKAERSRS